MTHAIGIDLGGTSIKYALIDREGNFVFQRKIPSMADVSAEAVIGQLVKAVKETAEYAHLQGLEIKGVGIGTPGIVDSSNRIVFGGADNIQGWSNLPLADRMEQETGLPTLLGNDANLMALGELRYGAGRGCTHIVFITVGTGIGGAVVIGGELFNGFDNRGTELGHTPLFADGEPCTCGSRGCLETYASTSSLVRRFEQACLEAGKPLQPHEVNGEELIRRYKEGDEIATCCLDFHCYCMARGVAGFINVFSPQRIVIGGGLSEAGEFYIEKIREQAAQHVMPDAAVNTRILAAELGNRAGSMGAAWLVFASK